MKKPQKPSPDFPLFAHVTKRWAKKIAGKLHYFGPWDDPAGALTRYLARPTKPAKPAKPAKPSPDFPLSAAANGQWCKRVRGKLRYFGTWDNPQAALDKWLAQKDDLLAGREPRVATNGLTVGGLVNHFLDHKKKRVKSGELKPRTWRDYQTVAKVVVKVLGRDRLVEDLQHKDFEKLRNKFAETHGLVALFNDINRARVIFKYADDQFQVRVRYGKSFEKPTQTALRRVKKTKLFTAAEIQQLIDTANLPLKAMILLGINCGFGNNDCATIAISDLDLDAGWHHFGRPKTGIERRCPLWPETVDALRDWLTIRPQPKPGVPQDRLFLTDRGNTWERKENSDDPIAKRFGKISSGGFYSLRRTFQTIGDASGQIVAVAYIMGHAPVSDDMSAIYRQHTFANNLIAASDYIYDWLFTHTEEPQQPGSVAAAPDQPRLRLYVEETSGALPQKRDSAAS